MLVITNKKTGKSFIAERFVPTKYNFATFYVKNMNDALQTLGDPRKLSPFIKKKDAIGDNELLTASCINKENIVTFDFEIINAIVTTIDPEHNKIEIAADVIGIS